MLSLKSLKIRTYFVKKKLILFVVRIQLARAECSIRHMKARPNIFVNIQES